MREAKREDLVQALDKVVGEAYNKQLELLREHILKDARKKIGEGSEALTFADLARRFCFYGLLNVPLGNPYLIPESNSGVLP